MVHLLHIDTKPPSPRHDHTDNEWLVNGQRTSGEILMSSFFLSFFLMYQTTLQTVLSPVDPVVLASFY